MYPAAAPVWDRLWRGVRARLGDAVPAGLSRPRDIYRHYEARGLVLGQACSLPMRLGLGARVAVVGAFDWGLPGTRPGHYRSVLVMRAGDRRPPGAAAARGVAVNEALSHSGWAALWRHARREGWRLGPRMVTGGHAASMAAVAAGRAHLAAIDAVTWRLAPHPALRVVGTTAESPGHALITRRPDLPLRPALDAAIAALPPRDRARTGLRGVVRLPRAAWAAPPTPPAP
jgi:hypothetical protein